MIQSILNSVKKTLNIDPSYTVFDEDILMHINSAFGTLKQLGLGPEVGFQIEDDTAVWEDFLGTDIRYSEVRSYIYLRVRLLFDPPGTSFLVTAIENQIKEMEWRLNVDREGTDWRDPNPVVPEDVTSFDGGVV